MYIHQQQQLFLTMYKGFLTESQRATVKRIHGLRGHRMHRGPSQQRQEHETSTRPKQKINNPN